MKTLKEVAEILKVTPSALRHRIRNKTLNAHKFGRDWFIDDSEVKRMVYNKALVKLVKSLDKNEQN